MIGFGLAGTNLIGLTAINTGLFIFNLNERLANPYLHYTLIEVIIQTLDLTRKQSVFFICSQPQASHILTCLLNIHVLLVANAVEAKTGQELFLQ